MKHYFSLRMGLLLLALLFVFAGCPNPVDSPNAPVGPETGPTDPPGEESPGDPETGEESDDPEPEEDKDSGEDETSESGGDPEEPTVIVDPEITEFTFTVAEGLKPRTGASGTVVGSFSDPEGGTPPFSFSLIAGKGGSDNTLFEVDGMNLRYTAGALTAGKYHVRLQATDTVGKTFVKAVIIPVSLVLSDYLTMIRVPSGAFLVNDTYFSDMGYSDRLSTVTVNQSFMMGQTEVTQDLWVAVMGTNPSEFIDNPAPGETQVRRPVERINWFDAIAFCNKLSLVMGKKPVYIVEGINFETLTYDQIPAEDSGLYSVLRWEDAAIDKTANGYRLPTKNEWTWAAMGADSQNPGQINATGYLKKYAGDPIGSTEGTLLYAWRYENSDFQTHAVGLRLPNELEIKDLSGNVSEWIWDRAGQAPSSLIRGVGGAHYYTLVDRELISEARLSVHVEYRTSNTGMRIVISE